MDGGAESGSAQESQKYGRFCGGSSEYKQTINPLLGIVRVNRFAGSPDNLTAGLTPCPSTNTGRKRMDRQLEREEEALERELDEGTISVAEYNREMKELHRDYRYAAEEASQQAYENEMDRW